ncbi:MAG: hypothetical protein A2Y34_01075 [Spirochaetes bacterium GWC1_27_15]|nr:MAG: hypothetical protein A2Z98_08095 [Spirochaetes bacterium GWB1_27_13]OHD23629.1 MAG: hypothetical protein A2Y34_01075 [Spirochaetes bacterium GWC1_27_15]
MNEVGCLICGNDLVYGEKELKKCEICKKEYETNCKCQNDHFICDDCHRLDSINFLETFIKETKLKDPVEMAEIIMKHSSYKMHGPEHHYLIPAVLLKSLQNNGVKVTDNFWELLKSRCGNLPGGICGYWGSCGGGVSSGIAASIFSDCTPLKKEEYRVVHKVTAACFDKIGDIGGPRCCKRNVILSLYSTISLFEKYYNIKIKAKKFICSFFNKNKECIKTECPFFPKKAESNG